MSEEDTFITAESGGEGERPGIGRRLLDIFVETPAEGVAAYGEGAGETSEFTPEGGSSGATNATPSGEPAGTAGVLDADLPTLYQKLGAGGDPNTDTFLEAFAGMSAMDESSRRTAMGAMAKGMRADLAAVSETLVKRAKALQFVIQQQSTAAKERQDARTATLEAQRTTTESKVAELQAEVARLQGALDAKVLEAKEATAADSGAIQGFKARVATEVSRLQALQQFLATLGKK